ncbi:MAG: HEAT repeat domain-containing protein [Elusimicrobia bacterium]|nr:HEAT repeat domain-containing protein [Elusimicrobiota bacterium]
MIRWIILTVIFAGGSYYLFIYKKSQAPADQTQSSAKPKPEQVDEVLPPMITKPYLLKFSKDTLKILRSLTQDANEKVRFASAELLWQMQDEQIPEIIASMLREETEPAVKKSLIDLLAKEKSRLSMSLLAIATQDYDRDVRIKAIETIGNFSNKEAIPILNKSLNDYDEEVRLKAVEAINKVRKDVEEHRETKLEERKITPIFRIE